MSKEESQNAPIAETAKPQNSEAPANSSSVQLPKSPVLHIDIAKLDANMLKTAEGLGIPLAGILQYVVDLQEFNKGVAQTLESIITNLEPAIKRTVLGMVQTAREEAAKAAPVAVPSPISAPGGASTAAQMMQYGPQLLQLLKEAGITGGGGDDVFKKMAMEAFESDIAFSKALKQTVLSKLTSKIASEVVP